MLFPRQILVRQLEIRLGSAGAAVINCHGLAIRLGASGQPDIPGNHGLEEAILEKLAQCLGNLLGQIGAIVIHGQQHAFDRDSGIKGGLDALQRRNQLGNAFEREVFGLHGHNQGVCRDQNIQSEQIERWRAVENDQVVILP